MVPGTTILFRRLVALILKIIDILLHVWVRKKIYLRLRLL
jgi:hypothetical protein